MKGLLVRVEEWPSFSPDVYPLDYFYWEFVKIKVYEGRSRKLFASESELNIKNLFGISVKMSWCQ